MVSVAAIHSIAKATEYGVYSMISGGTMWESGSCGTTQKRRTLKMTKKGRTLPGSCTTLFHTQTDNLTGRKYRMSHMLSHTPL